LQPHYRPRFARKSQSAVRANPDLRG
jgi:hypothetical protein